MSDQIKQTEVHVSEVFDAVREYMPGVAKRLVTNYAILISGVLLVTMVLVPLLIRFFPIPLSTARTIGFALNLVWLIKGWQYLENRNRATGLYVMYTRFSRSRRDVEAVLAKEKPKTENVSALIEDMENTAESFIQTAEELEVEIVQRK